MAPQRAVLGGLVAGVGTGIALLTLLVLAIVLVPATPPPASAAPSPAEASAAPGEGAGSGAGSPVTSASLAAEGSSGAGGSGGPSPTPAPSPASPFAVGEPAPPLVVRQLGGGTIDLASLRGRPVWVTFMATWCPSCREELPRMALAAARHARDGLVVLAVDVGEEAGTVAAYFSELGVTLPVGLDPDGAAMERWRVLALPVHFWIDAEGIVRFGALGGVGPDVFAEGLATILPGSSPAP